MPNTNTTKTEILSIHTLTYRYRCSFQTYYGLFQYLVQNRNCIFTKHKHKTCEKYTTRTLHPLGFNRIEFIDCMIPDRDYHEYKIKFTINPRILTGQTSQPRTHIIAKEQLSQLPDILDTAIHDLCSPYKEQLTDGKFQRIDYCCNLWFIEQELAEEYMRLLRKALIPYPFELEKILSNSQHRYIPEPNAITITCKSYQLSIYLKLNQLLDEITRQENGIIPSEHVSEIENAIGQIRIELREYRSQLRINKKKIHCGNDEAFLLNGSNTHPYTTLCKRLGSMYGTGDFWLYDDARDIIKESDYKPRIKKELLEILKVVNAPKSGLDISKNGFDYIYLKSHMRYFNELDLSPITISQKSFKRCGENFFPNPRKYISGETAELLRTSDI